MHFNVLIIHEVVPLCTKFNIDKIWRCVLYLALLQNCARPLWLVFYCKYDYVNIRKYDNEVQTLTDMC